MGSRARAKRLTSNLHLQESTKFMHDPYSILGVPKNANDELIKKEYRRLARANHPDSKPGDPMAEDRFKKISSAYAILSDPAKRKKFDCGEIDANGNNKNNGSGFATHSYAPSGFSKTQKSRFEHFFKDRQKKSSIKAKGADISYTLKVSFLDAALGANKTVRMATNKSLKVKIPPGTEEGQVLRLKGQGMAGTGGGIDGDAMVEINVAPDPVFSRKGMDIFSELPVGVDEALLGARIEAQTIHGIVSLVIPENSNSGTRLRLKGRGVRTNNGAIGDQYVTLKIMLPEKTDKTFVDFIRTWVSANPYNPRNKKTSESEYATPRTNKKTSAAK